MNKYCPFAAAVQTVTVLSLKKKVSEIKYLIRKWSEILRHI